MNLAVLDRPVSMRALAVLRIAVGPVVLLHLRPFLDDARHGRIYRDVFHEPYAAWYPELPRRLYVAVLVVAAVAAVAMALGVATRLAAGITFAAVAYNLFLSTTNVHNNRAYLVVVLGVLAVAPCGRELSVDAWWRRRRHPDRPPPAETTAPGWPLVLLRAEASIVYGASGLSKLVDPDWFGGTVTWLRLVHVRDRLETSVLPHWAVTVLLDRGFHTWAAKIVIATELAIALGLWWRRTRYAAVWLAICFHVAIQLSASVEVFSFLAIAVLAIWVVPSTRDRAVVVRSQRAAAAVRALDWFARFRIEVDPQAPATRVVDRDGTTLHGEPARTLLLSRLPLTAWFALPARRFR